MTVRMVSTVMGSLLLAGCGLAGTGGAAAVSGTTAAEQAKAAEQQMEKIQLDLEAAQKAATDARAAAEAAAQ